MRANDYTSSTDAEHGLAGSRASTAVKRPSRQHPLLGLQGAAGNAAVVQMLRTAGYSWAQEQHQHGAGCGHRADQPAVQRRSAVHDVLSTPGSPLDTDTLHEMEGRLDADFSDVRIHTGSAAKAASAQVSARALTSGNHIVVGEGGADKHTLAHELTHVVQQRQGPVLGTDNGSGLSVSDPSDRFEKAAEENATRVMSQPAQRAPRAEGSAHAPSAEGSAGPSGLRPGATAVQRAKSDTIGANISSGLGQYNAQITELAGAVGTTPHNVLNALLDPAYDPMGAHAIDAQILDMNLKNPLDYASCFPTAHALFPVLTDPAQVARAQGPNPEKARSLEEFQAAVTSLVTSIQETWSAGVQAVFRVEYAGHGFTLVIRKADDGEAHIELIESLAHAAAIIPSLSSHAFDLDHVLRALVLMAHPGVDDRVTGAGMLGWNAHALYLGNPSATEKERFPETRMRWWRLPLSPSAGENWANQFKLRFNFVADKYGTTKLT